MKQVLLFGAGKSATILIEYLLQHASAGGWELVVVDANLELAKSKIGDSTFGKAVAFDITNEADRQQYIRGAALVISMLPATLHYLVARDCVSEGRHLLTASYVDDQVRSMAQQVEDKNIIFLCEMGLDPGIDHMSAMKIVDEIHSEGGHITSFKSHCGGLVSPESDDNPWHYKISWNPRNIILAGKAGAHYLENGAEVNLSYRDLFSTTRTVNIPGLGLLGWYPNRDSLGYTSLYGLQDASTFVRTTLRHPDFMQGWNHIVELNLTDETPAYDTDGKSLAAVFKEHLDKNNFGEWLQTKMTERFKETQEILDSLTRLAEAESETTAHGGAIPPSFISADENGNLREIETTDVKAKAASFVARKMHEANLVLKQLMYLGIDDQETLVNKGMCSAADILQFAAERRLALGAGDKDMIVMLHEIVYELNGRSHTVSSSLVVKGEDGIHTAMAKTVGLPLGIAARLILNGTIQVTGLHIPTIKEIYEPVLNELEKFDVKFYEERS